jgi:hypothetical protein
MITQRVLADRYRSKGQSIVEMAFIAPILLIMFIGVIEVGWALRSFVVLQNATREAARFAARGRYMDFSQTDLNDIGYPYVVEHELDSIAGQIPLDVGGGTANSTIIISHVLVDTGECGGGTEDDLVLSPLASGYGHFMATFGLARDSRVDFDTLVDEMVTENEQFNCNLATRNPEAIPSVNSVIVVESYFPHQLVVNMPLVSDLITDESGVVWLYARTIMRITADSRGQVASAGQGCEVYPIAINTSTLDNHQAGDSLGDIYNGAGQGQFGWLRWNDWSGHTSETYLVEEFQNTRLSVNTFEDASDPTDTTLNAGDWVWGLTGVVNGNDVRDDLETLVANGTTIRIPVWDIASEGSGGANVSYHIDRFVRVQLTGYDMDHKTISAIFVGEDPDACPDIAVGGLATSTPTTEVGADTPTPTDTSTPTDTPTPTPTYTPVVPTGCSDYLPADDGGTWTSLDIGGATTGYTGSNTGSVYLCGSGSDIGGTSDAFRYAYQVVNSSNLEVIARVASWNGSVNGWSKGGLMIRNATAPSSAHEAGLLTGSNGLYKEWRASDSSTTSEYSGGSLGAPIWMRLLKIGTTIVTYRSSDGSSWTRVGDPDTVNLGSTYLAGMAVSSHDNAQYAYATFDSVDVNTSPATTAVASDDFESGGTSGGTGWSAAWTVSSSNVEATTQDTTHAGSYHLRFRNAAVTATRTVDLSDVVGGRLQFWWRATTFESADTAAVSVYDGTWHTVLTATSTEADDTYYFADIDLSGYTMTSSFQVRVEANIDSSNDYFYVDDLVITGYE